MLHAALAALAMSCCADLPPGFERTVVCDDLNNPLALDFLPDGRLVVAERIGAIVIAEQGVPRTVLTLSDISTDQEGGILGMAVDPDFSIDPYIYVYYTTAAHRNRVGRFEFQNDRFYLDSEVVIWENPQPETGFTHHGGFVGFGPDGKLYVATGEETESQWAQDGQSQRGKILRMNRDGTIPADNPFVGEANTDPLIFARGFRNPFRCSIDPLTGVLYAGDVGQDFWEEITRITPGANGGWPDMEGPDCFIGDCSAFTRPLWSYPHCDATYSPACNAAVIAGPVYRAEQFPPEFRGNLFVADHINSWIRRLVFDAGGNVSQDVPFATGDDLATLVDLKIGPDGALYYVGIFNTPSGLERVFRVAYGASSDHAPVAVISSFATGGPDAPVSVHFDGSGSTDDDTPPSGLSYFWEFGDGDVSEELSPTHVYTQRGRFVARLTVSDGELHDSAETTITVGLAPAVSIDEPAAGAHFRAGDVLLFSGSADDAEDGPLPAAALTWDVVIVHANHTHPYYGPVSGQASGGFAAPSLGHPPENSFFRVTLRAVDSDGIESRASVDILPAIAPLALDTEPVGIPLFLDGNPIPTPRLYESVAGFHHVVEARPTARVAGWPYRFAGWSDGYPEARRDVWMPDLGEYVDALYEPACTADFNLDLFVTGDDFDLFITYFEAGDPRADVNHDAFVSGDDFDVFIVAFLEGC